MTGRRLKKDRDGPLLIGSVNESGRTCPIPTIVVVNACRGRARPAYSA